MVDHVPHNEDGVGGAHLYMPWWLDNKSLDFPRGYHIEIWGGLGAPSYGSMDGIQSYPSGGGYGKTTQGRLSEILWRHDRILRSGRADSQ